jgi:hypothetical protein
MLLPFLTDSPLCPMSAAPELRFDDDGFQVKSRGTENRSIFAADGALDHSLASEAALVRRRIRQSSAHRFGQFNVLRFAPGWNERDALDAVTGFIEGNPRATARTVLTVRLDDHSPDSLWAIALEHAQSHGPNVRTFLLINAWTRSQHDGTLAATFRGLCSSAHRHEWPSLTFVALTTEFFDDGRDDLDPWISVREYHRHFPVALDMVVGLSSADAIAFAQRLQGQSGVDAVAAAVRMGFGSLVSVPQGIRAVLGAYQPMSDEFSPPLTAVLERVASSEGNIPVLRSLVDALALLSTTPTPQKAWEDGIAAARSSHGSADAQETLRTIIRLVPSLSAHALADAPWLLSQSPWYAKNFSQSAYIRSVAEASRRGAIIEGHRLRVIALEPASRAVLYSEYAAPENASLVRRVLIDLLPSDVDVASLLVAMARSVMTESSNAGDEAVLSSATRSLADVAYFVPFSDEAMQFVGLWKSLTCRLADVEQNEWILETRPATALISALLERAVKRVRRSRTPAVRGAALKHVAAVVHTALRVSPETSWWIEYPWPTEFVCLLQRSWNERDFFQRIVVASCSSGLLTRTSMFVSVAAKSPLVSRRARLAFSSAVRAAILDASSDTELRHLETEELLNFIIEGDEDGEGEPSMSDGPSADCLPLSLALNDRVARMTKTSSLPPVLPVWDAAAAEEFHMAIHRPEPPSQVSVHDSLLVGALLRIDFRVGVTRALSAPITDRAANRALLSGLLEWLEDRARHRVEDSPIGFPPVGLTGGVWTLSEACDVFVRIVTVDAQFMTYMYADRDDSAEDGASIVRQFLIRAICADPDDIDETIIAMDMLAADFGAHGKALDSYGATLRRRRLSLFARDGDPA